MFILLISGFYSEQCAREYPLRCETGDMAGKHGRIDIGAKAYVFNDARLPLSGDWFSSAVGKSIVINAPDGGPEKMACANIEAEKEIVKYASIRTKSDFNLATFIEEVQAIMGVPEWFLFIDSRETVRLHGGGCIKIKLHFAGPQANRLEQDFSRLLRTGRLDAPSLYIPGYIAPPDRKPTLGYRECGGADSRKPSGSSSNTIKDLYKSLTGTSGGSRSSSPATLVILVTLLASTLAVAVLGGRTR
jgi:hypothetical protein